MRTPEEVKYEFAAVPKLDEGQKMRLLKIEKEFTEMAMSVLDLVPESANRTSALRKMLIAKFECVQAVTHPYPVIVKKVTTTPEIGEEKA